MLPVIRTRKMAKDQIVLRKHFIETLYSVLGSVISPTPYLEIAEGSAIDVRFLDGKGRLPRPNATEVTILDIDLASLFFDEFHILYEGVTGVGKSYTSEALLKTIFGPSGYYTLRLSGGILGNSALEPFTTTTLENGVPRTRIDPEKCQEYGALFIDEINRGDSQEVFQVVDGVVHVNGETGHLRLPIPGQKGKYKGLAIIAAMNPADSQHSSAIELDIAGENRFLKFRFPNGVAEAGSSQLEKRAAEGLHERFWAEFSRRTGFQGKWQEIYPVVTNPEQLPRELDGATKEFIDVALGYVGHDPKETFGRNIEIIREGRVTPKISFRNDNSYRKILEIQGKLKHGFVRRDLRKIRDLSRLLAFVKGVKDGSYNADVTLDNVAAGIGIILESKTITGTDYGSLLALVNDARSAYADLRDKMGIPEYGARQAVWNAALNAGKKQGFEAYANTLRLGMEKVNQPTESAAQATIRSRVLADLVVLEHFSKMHEADVAAALKLKGDGAYRAFDELYQAKKGQNSIYEHRLESIIN